MVRNSLVRLVGATAECLGKNSKSNKSADPLCGFGYSRKNVAGKSEVDAIEQARENFKNLLEETTKTVKTGRSPKSTPMDKRKFAKEGKSTEDTPSKKRRISNK